MTPCCVPGCDAAAAVTTVDGRRMCEFHRGFWAGFAARIVFDIYEDNEEAA